MLNTKIIATVNAENNGSTYATNLNAAGHIAIADEPESAGGKDTGPSPVDYLCMSLASCKAITLRMYVERKKWDIQNIKVEVSLERVEAEGSATHVFYAEISADETISPEQKERLITIAKACPISKLLGKQNEVVTKYRTPPLN
jgi:putative redox protein